MELRKDIALKKYRFLFCLFLFGCTAPLAIPPTYRNNVIQTPNFDFVVWQKVEQPKAPYKIYIEGDGYAFDSQGKPTDDPTPQSTLVRAAAFADPHPNVVYMARACQYIQRKKCSQEYWTTSRFASEVVAAQADAVKQIVGTSPVTFVGFSGGAQIAGLIAVTDRKIKVQKIITVGGNLDHPAWTAHHNVPPLTGSADLNDYRSAFAKIPQIHYVGEKDTVMPPSINQNFVADTAEVIVVEGAEHNTGWDKVMPQIWQE